MLIMEESRVLWSSYRYKNHYIAPQNKQICSCGGRKEVRVREKKADRKKRASHQVLKYSGI